jgi:hypothetical protein
MNTLPKIIYPRPYGILPPILYEKRAHLGCAEQGLTAKMAKIIVACEVTQAVCAAFRALGHEAFSCDLQPTEGNPAWHYQCDMFELNYSKFDCGIFHPDCTALAVSGNGTYYNSKERDMAIDLVCKIWEIDLCHLCIENPIGVLSSPPGFWHKGFMPPTQYINPWEYGHGETKKTCIWLRGLPKLIPTNIVPGREQRIWKMSPSEHRKRERARTYQGWANAMAHQWGSYLNSIRSVS